MFAIYSFNKYISAMNNYNLKLKIEYNLYYQWTA